MTNLVESYKNRIAIAESYYSKKHEGEKMDSFRKASLGRCLENINQFLTEAYSNSTGTQRSDMGDFKKFSLNLTTVTLPNLIANDIVLVYPMSSMSGYVNYLEYTAGSDKGTTAQGTVLNSPFGLGAAQVDYTGASISESHTATSGDASANKIALDWTPIAKLVAVKVGNVAKTIVDKNAVLTAGQVKAGADGTVEFYAGELSESDVVSVLYQYNNEVIPQNDLPILNVQMKTMPLLAHARRIAVYYSNLASFQAKQDYGFDMGSQLAEHATAELAYEIDTEVCQLLIDNAPADGDLVWSKTLPIGVSKREHYAGFTEILEQARQKVYDRTRRFLPNFMLISSSILPILSMIDGFKAASVSDINGPYLAGTLNGLKIFVTPAIANGEFVVGVNGNDMKSTAAVYAPYMPIVPTQLLEYADGGTSQGFSTMYDLKILNANLLVSGRVTA